MIHVFKRTFLLLLCMPWQLAAQSVGNDLPLPPVKGVSMVVRMYYSFMPSRSVPARFDKDTESVYLIAADGHAFARYISESGLCAGLETYKYKEGRLVQRSYFSSVDRHSIFTPLTAHSHRPVWEDSWDYSDGKVAVERHYAGPDRILTREIQYEYDVHGRLQASYFNFPKQTLLYYPSRFESVHYRYSGDSVYRVSYRQGKPADSLAYLERYDHKGLLRERHEVSPEGRHFERTLRRYDSSNRMVDLETFSDRPSVNADGTVIRADRVEYTYDEKGRPDEVRYFARGLKRWIYKYSYLK